LSQPFRVNVARQRAATKRRVISEIKIIGSGLGWRCS
jgi:hypothetical protein